MLFSEKGVIKVFGVVLITLYGFIWFLLMTVVYMPIICLLGEERGGMLARKELKKFSRGLLRSVFAKVEIIYIDEEAIKLLDRNSGIVVVGNHQSNMDIPLISGYFPMDLGFVAKQEMEKWPFYGMWMKKSHCIFLNRSNPREGIKSIKKAVEIIKSGYPTVIFPEGERSLTGDIIDFKKGSFRLATDTDGIIVPITVKGTYDIQKRGKLSMNMGRTVKLIIDKPIDVKNYTKEERKTLDMEVKNIIEENYRRY